MPILTVIAAVITFTFLAILRGTTGVWSGLFGLAGIALALGGGYFGAALCFGVAYVVRRRTVG